jgi:hypothetical protein
VLVGEGWPASTTRGLSLTIFDVAKLDKTTDQHCRARRFIKSVQSSETADRGARSGMKDARERYYDMNLDELDIK